MSTKKTLSIVLNRLVSLTAQYGHVIALNLILAKISVNAVLILWLVKLLGDLLATALNQFIKPIHSAKLFLFMSEVIRAILLLLMPLFFQSYFLFAIVLVFEILGDIFSSYLMTTIPFLVPKDNLSRFNASITLVGSISYFVGPLLVGIFQSFSQTILFLFYGGLTAIAAMLLLILPAISLTPISNEAPNFKKNFKRIGHLFKLYRNYLYVFLLG
ncbi:MAG: hypothetical protein LKE89_04940 [Lactobacillaceae bacterium]|nr:hypothetical protein [Lactobacillaceae bacterium]